MSVPIALSVLVAVFMPVTLSVLVFILLSVLVPVLTKKQNASNVRVENGQDDSNEKVSKFVCSSDESRGTSTI